MTRREFMAAMSAAGLLPLRSSASTPFAVHYAKPNPYDAVLRYVDPGSDEFQGEKDAVELEARLERILAGREAAPAGLSEWAARRGEIRAARFYALPNSQVRYEIKTETEYHTGVWQLPDFKAVTATSVTSPKPYFRDVTEHVFGGVTSFREQLIPGNPYWRARLDSACGIDVYGNQGIAVADIDNDGADEIYVCQPGGLPNRLYKVRGDGTAEDLTERSGLGVLDETTCALFADFSNSGRQDAVVLRSSGPLLFVNRGDGTFVEQREAFQFKTTPQGSFTGMAAADFDRDGRLDLYLCCYIYFQSEDQYQYPAPYQDARNGPPNFLFRNRGTPALHFEDVTAETGMNENNDRFSFAPAWCDFDGDGWPDLFVANDFGRGNLYRNRNGKFRDEGCEGRAGRHRSWHERRVVRLRRGRAPGSLRLRYVDRRGAARDSRSGLPARGARCRSVPAAHEGQFPVSQQGRRHVRGDRCGGGCRDGPLGVELRRIRLGPGRRPRDSDLRRHGHQFGQSGPEWLFLAAGGGQDSREAARRARLRKRLERSESAHSPGLQLERSRTECVSRETLRRVEKRVPRCLRSERARFRRRYQNLRGDRFRWRRHSGPDTQEPFRPADPCHAERLRRSAPGRSHSRCGARNPIAMPLARAWK